MLIKFSPRPIKPIPRRWQFCGRHALVGSNDRGEKCSHRSRQSAVILKKEPAEGQIAALLLSCGRNEIWGWLGKARLSWLRVGSVLGSVGLFGNSIIVLFFHNQPARPAANPEPIS